MNKIFDEVLFLKAKLDITYEEIANHLNLTRGTVSELFRGRGKLQNFVDLVKLLRRLHREAFGKDYE